MRALPRAFALMKRRRPGLGPVRGEQTTGILLLCAAVLCFTLMDASAKQLTQTYSPLQVVWARFIGNIAFVALILRGSLPRMARSRQPRLQFFRALTQLASVLLFFTSLQFIGLAEASAIMDLNPVLITLGAALFLGERIGIRRILGILAAMIGAMIIIRPGASVFDPGALLPLVGAFTYASGALLTRMVRSDSAATSMLWSAIIGGILTSLAVPFVWQPIQAQHLWAFLSLAFFGTISQWFLIRAFAIAEAGVLAPFGYSGLVWAGLWGWLFFGQLPDLWTILGAAIIVGAGLYVWWRETRTAQDTA